MGRKAAAKVTTKAVVDDVLTEEEISKAAAIAEASDNADEGSVESAVAEVETADAVAKANAKTTGDKPASAKAAPKEPAAPRMSLATHSASEIIATRLGSDHHALFDLDGSKKPTAANLRKTQAATLKAIDGLDKKSREKGINLFTSANNEKAPSVYTRMACSLLQSKGEFTQKTLTDHYLAAGYMIGTARRQAGEMVALFPVVGIVTKASERGSPCIRNDASTLYQAIKKTPAATGKS